MKNKIDTMIPPMPAEPLTKRLLYCSALLNIWGMLTDAEREKVNQRIEKRFLKEAKAR